MDALLPDDLAGVLRHCEREFPREACGALLRHRDGRWEHRPLANAYDAHHAKDPSAWPASSRTAFLVAPAEWIRLEDDASTAGARIACLYHSHCDAEATLSDDDVAFAAPLGEPLLPGLTLLVVSVRARRAAATRLFTWSGRGFEPLGPAP